MVKYGGGLLQEETVSKVEMRTEYGEFQRDRRKGDRAERYEVVANSKSHRANRGFS